ncbi:aminopeptidase N-like isoform X2 [Macrobrachium nipponense]|uniref:aminopeptidase N-like isoform X2 n=1 Tax=Macrobrachium nipponense TaxID=159736 RepID=UPI0030C7AFCC
MPIGFFEGYRRSARMIVARWANAYTTLILVLLTLITAVANASVEEVDAKQIIILPKTLKPIHYNVWLQPFINGNFSIEGKVAIDFEVLQPTYYVILHMTDIITKNESSRVLEKDSGHEVSIIQQRYEPLRNLYIATLQEQLEVGRLYTFSLKFVGTLGEQARGFYRSSYRKENGETSWVASTQFQSTDARRAFPCFDEPGLKATFKIYLARENHMNALSNMPMIRSTPIEDQPGWVWDEFQKSVPMSTYLVAFAVSDFPSVVLTAPGSPTTIRAVTREAVIRDTHLAGEVSRRALSFFEQFFQLRFPLPKIDMIALPENSFAAMENWGLMTYRENGLLHDPEKASAEDKQWVSYLISHELAHQWFGNLVTLKWWTDLWLNEGFATYMGDMAVDHIEPAWGIMDQFVVRRLQEVFALDALESSHPISVPVIDPIEIIEIFDSISYLKGASIIRMMSYFLTEETFRNGLKNYLTTLKYKNADQDDLWEFLTNAAHEEGTLPLDLTVKTIMDTWTLQKGFPLVTVVRNGNNSAKITQEQFYLDKQTLHEHRQRWWIPATYTSQENLSFEDTRVKFWIHEKETYPEFVFPESHHWVIFNVKQSGYYRVNYDLENWNLLMQQLRTNHEVIHVTNRAQIIDDALNLARAGYLPYDTALGLTSYLSKERSYVVWKAALHNFQYLYDMFQHDPAYGAFREYMMSVISPIYEYAGFKEQPRDDLQKQLLSGEAVRWACKLRHPDCIYRSTKLFRQWMYDQSTYRRPPSSIAEAAFCTAVREGEIEEWQFAWSKDLDNALACSESIWILARYLRGAFNESSGLRRQDAAIVFSQIARGSVGSIVSWEYMRSNWNQIADYIGTAFFGLPRVVAAVTRRFKTQQRLKELMQFQQDYAENLLTANRAVEQAIETTKVNIAWMEDNYEGIVHWLREQGFSSDLSH